MAGERASIFGLLIERLDESELSADDILNWRMKMIEYFKAKEDGDPGKLHIVVRLTDEFVNDIKTTKDSALKEALIDILASEVEGWIEDSQ